MPFNPRFWAVEGRRFPQTHSEIAEPSGAKAQQLILVLLTLARKTLVPKLPLIHNSLSLSGKTAALSIDS
jgi:hypothetical protein